MAEHPGYVGLEPFSGPFVRRREEPFLGRKANGRYECNVCIFHL